MRSLVPNIPASGRASDRRSRRAPHVLDRTQRIAAPRPEVFEFFSDPRNLARITPPWLKFRIAGNPPGEIREGTRIEYRIRWSVLTLRWLTRITRWEPGSLFEDVQQKGPYRSWRHTHSFASEGPRTLVRDRVEYELPFGALGRLVHALAVRRQLEGIFDYRRRAIAEIFPDAD